jgi:hypothetical protein
MIIEQMCDRRAHSPEELLAMFPKVEPFDQDVFLKPTDPRQNKGTFVFDVGLFRSVGRFDWAQLYQFSEKKVPSSSNADLKQLAPSSQRKPLGEPLTARDLLYEEC